MTLPRLVATFLGAGLSPVAPGTVGSLAALLPGVLLLWASPVLLAVAALLSIPAGFWAVRAARAESDPGWVVIDEVAGQWIALLALARPAPLGILACFLAFRLFDILKPGPIGWAERLPGPAGVIMDDVLAGLAAGLLVSAVQLALPGWLD
ncbi:Phosphatidylglycerophosphatase A [Rhodovastum atsumiense]|uniref:Phosphatidylglycerophosphatase A n=1 Tax=Rhodovastum atsumiense TaxID=504468 RepID=A0A5M6IPA2_9PROT|nr:phosphatidylglycerophosphatase A [Rhodovastum atsumiense]KAA5609729.1 phosphatidylglycerophosphatase A [Rhodovastum atsumiense]CAH2604499.1 Phosphatidylglycerophosphatase A [Rhodovastum atsumiense]